jgi:hypothetical protein
MNSIVLELQRDALDSTRSTTDLLRKALVVARKLALGQFQTWINLELNGYPKYEEIPEYRNLQGQVRGWNPFHGWQPAIINDADVEVLVNHRKIGQPMSELENLANRQASGNGTLQVPFTGKHREILCRMFDEDETEFSLFVSGSAVVGIIDSVRNTVLNWCLQLEQDGVMGENLSFTADEKKAATNGNYQHTNNFFGAVQSAQIQQSSPSSSQVAALGNVEIEAIRKTVHQVVEALPNLPLTDSDSKGIRADLGTINAQLESPKPKSSIIRESLNSIRAVLEGAAAGVGTELLVEIGKLLSKHFHG